MNDPAKMAELMPGVQSFAIKDDRNWTAIVKVPLGLGSLAMTVDFEQTEVRPPEYSSLHAKGNGVGAIMNMQTSFTLEPVDGGHEDALERRGEPARAGRRDGAARAAADREAAGQPGAGRARQAGHRDRRRRQQPS